MPLPRALLLALPIGLGLWMLPRPGATIAAGERVLAAESASDGASACAGAGCQCPHEDLHSDCCCGPDAEPEVEVAGTSVPLEPAHVALVAARERTGIGLPASIVTSFHCSGGKRGSVHASSDVPPVAAIGPVSGSECATRRSWGAKNEPGPPYDLRTEPGTPPPRVVRA